MVNYTCMSCEGTFIATSQAEAEEAYNSQVEKGDTAAASFSDAVDTGEVAYAKFCPYCGATAVKVSKEVKHGR